MNRADTSKTGDAFDPDNPEWTRERIEKGVPLSELPADVQRVIRGIQRPRAAAKFLIGLVSAGGCLGLLFVMYPWATYYRNFSYGIGITLASYFVLALFVGLILAIVSGIMTLRSGLARLAQSIMTAFVSFVFLCVSSVFLGPGGFNIYGTRVRGIFFSEWKFITFDLCIALPISILGATMGWWASLRRRPVQHL